MSAALDRYYTREEVLAFPDDGNRYELVHGELLVSPSPIPRHQQIVGRVHLRLAPFLEGHPLFTVLLSPADLSWGRATTIVQPDIFVVRGTSLANDWAEMREFPLFVEVLSPSTARYDRFTKRRLYQEMKVPLYWIIDPQMRRAEVWTPEATRPVFEDETLIWAPPEGVEPFRLGLQRVFE